MDGTYLTLLATMILLKVTNEQQDNGSGILYQVAKFPIDQVYFIYIYKAPMQDPETGYWLQSR